MGIELKTIENIGQTTICVACMNVVQCFRLLSDYISWVAIRYSPTVVTYVYVSSLLWRMERWERTWGCIWWNKPLILSQSFIIKAVKLSELSANRISRSDGKEPWQELFILLHLLTLSFTYLKHFLSDLWHYFLFRAEGTFRNMLFLFLCEFQALRWFEIEFSSHFSIISFHFTKLNNYCGCGSFLFFF